MQRLLSHLHQDKRVDVLTNAVKDGYDIAVPLRLMDRWLREHQIVKSEGTSSRYDGEPAIPARQIEALKTNTLGLIHTVADDGRLAESTNMPAHLYTWKHLEDPAKPTEWVAEQITEENGLLDTLVKFLSPVSSSDKGDYERFTMEWFHLWIDPHTLIDRIRTLQQSNTPTERQRLALDAFVTAYDRGKENDNWKYH